jgi:hypothetical protein
VSAVFVKLTKLVVGQQLRPRDMLALQSVLSQVRATQCMPLLITVWAALASKLHTVVVRLHRSLAGAMMGGFCCLTSLMYSAHSNQKTL